MKKVLKFLKMIFVSASILIPCFLVNGQETGQQPFVRLPIHQAWKWDADVIFKDKDADVRALIRAIETDDLDEITRLVEGGVDINTRGEMNITPLIWAILADDKTFLRLLELGADPNIPVALTTRKNYPEIFCYCLTQGTVINNLCRFHMESLVYEFKNQEKMQIERPKLRDALKYGGDPNATEYSHLNESPLMQVSRNQSGGVGFRLLLEAGADPNYFLPAWVSPSDPDSKIPSGKTVLMIYLEANSSPLTIEQLIDAGADVCGQPGDGFPGYDVVLFLIRKEMQKTFSYDEFSQRHEVPFNQTLWVEFHYKLRDRMIAMGADYELAKEMLKTDNDVKKARNIPFNQRPWLMPILEKRRLETEKAAD